VANLAVNANFQYDNVPVRQASVTVANRPGGEDPSSPRLYVTQIFTPLPYVAGDAVLNKEGFDETILRTSQIHVGNVFVYSSLIAALALYLARGWRRKLKGETTLDRTTDVVSDQGLFGRLLNIGTVHIHTAGTGFPSIRLDGIRDRVFVRGTIIIK